MTLRTWTKPGGEILHGGLQRLEMTSLTTSAAEADVTASYYRLPAGRRLTRHIHDERTEVWFLVEGTAVVEIGGEETNVSSPCAVITPPDQAHAMTAGPEDVVFAAFATPAVRVDAAGNRVGTEELE